MFICWLNGFDMGCNFRGEPSLIRGERALLFSKVGVGEGLFSLLKSLGEIWDSIILGETVFTFSSLGVGDAFYSRLGDLDFSILGDFSILTILAVTGVFFSVWILFWSGSESSSFSYSLNEKS